MKTYTVDIVDETHFCYTVEAKDYEEAEALALERHTNGTPGECDDAYQGVQERRVSARDLKTP